MGGYAFDRRLHPAATPLSPGDLPGFSTPSTEVPSFILAGVDEAGRGPLAGPVVAAAVILPLTPRISGLRDSKALSSEQRDGLFDEIRGVAVSVGVAFIDAAEIDATNILIAALKAMRNAIAALSVRPDLVVVDGNQRPGSGHTERVVIKADTHSAAVMAASIIAKVTRDRWMIEAHQKYPHYGFDRHKGYGAASHLAALRTHGPCLIHRRSFAPVRELLENSKPLLTTPSV